VHCFVFLQYEGGNREKIYFTSMYSPGSERFSKIQQVINFERIERHF